MLQMNLFGSVRLEFPESRILRFRGQTEVALLIYLAQTRQSHRRDALADLLWDARSSKQALVIGKVVLSYWPPKNWGLVKHGIPPQSTASSTDN